MFKILYGTIVCSLMAEYFAWLFFYAEPFVTPVWLVMIRLAVSFIALWKGRLWKDRGFLVLLSFYTLLVLRVALGEDANRLFDLSVSEALMNSLWAFTGCYAAARVLKRNQLLPFLKGLLAVWTILVTVHSGIALYAAWNNHVVWTIGGGGFWGLGDTFGGGDYHYLMRNATATTGIIRLYTPLYATTGGSLLAISTILALLGAIFHRRKWIKALYCVSVFPVFTAMALTDTRTAHVMTAAGIAILVFAGVMGTFRKKAADTRPRNGIAWLSSVSAMAVAFVIMVFAASITIRMFNTVRMQLNQTSVFLISSASAEETEAASEEDNSSATLIVSSRGFSGADVLTYRPTIWKSVISYLQDHPMALLTGASLYYPMNGPNAQPESMLPAGHCHCMPLHLILVSGIPGLLMILIFVIHIAICSIRLVTGKRQPMWVRMLPAVIVAIMVGELVECFTNIAYPWPTTPVLMIFCGIVSALGGRHPFHSFSEETIIPQGSL